MNIAHVGNYKKESANGVNQCIYNISSRQKSLGHNVYVYSFDNVTEVIQEETTEGVIVVRFPQYRVNGFLLSSQFKIYLKANPDNIDIIHFHSVFVPYNNMIAGIINIPYVITPHGGYSTNCYKRSLFSSIKKDIYYLLFEKYYILNAAAIHCLNENERSQLRYLDRIGSKTVIIPNGVNMVSVNSQNCRSRLNKDEINLLFIGRLDKVHKGLDNLIEGLKLYNERYGEGGYKLYIVGPDVCDHRRGLEELVCRLGLQHCIVFKDKVMGTEKSYLLSEVADLFVHTSRWEGMPISVLEAMSYGVPVFISKETNLGDLVVASSSGWVLDSIEPDCIAQKLSEIRDTDLKLYSANAMALARREFCWDTIVDRVLYMYYSCLSK